MQFHMPVKLYFGPDLIKTLPKSIIASTGLDALTHAVEAYLSKPATPVTDTNALAAVQLILGSVENAFTDIENNHGDRERLMYGSTIAAQLFITHITDLSKRLGIPVFKDLNIGKGQFETIADMSFHNNSNGSNPRPLEPEDYLKILENAFE